MVVSQQHSVQWEVAGACVPAVAGHQPGLEELSHAPEHLQGFSQRKKILYEREAMHLQRA